MNVVEMHNLCDLLLDKANSPWFNSEEKDVFLNLAHEEFVETRYRLFEIDERTRKELLPLVRREEGSSSSEIILDNINNYMFTLNLSGEFIDSCNNKIWRKISPLQLDDEVENQNDPFNKSDDENPLYTEEHNGSNNVVIIKSDNSPSKYILKYLKRSINVFRDDSNPSNNVDSELPVFTHEEIVNIAVRKMMATTEQQLNYQLHNNEINNQN